MIKHCEGCGATLQVQNPDGEGYAKTEQHSLCERCFRIRNYNDYKTVIKDNESFLELLAKVKESKALVLLVVDMMHLSVDIEQIVSHLDNPILLVLTKRDLLPKTTYNRNLLDYMEHFHIPCVDKIMISSENNYHFDLLYQLIEKYQNKKEVYVVGLTNAGKSTMLNQLIYHYGETKRVITTSMLPSTTMNFITIPMTSTLTLIDTPGILDQGNMVDLVDDKMLKRITPKVEIKPRTYQIKESQIHLIEDIARFDYTDKNSVTYFIANPLKLTRYYKEIDTLKNLVCHEIEIEGRQDIVISGFGFVKVMKPCIVKVYVQASVLVYTRDALI